MLLKLLSFLIIAAHAIGSGAPTTSPRPTARPDNLQITDNPRDGEVRDGKVRLSIVFYKDGVFYQRNNRTENIPIMHYFRNEYPNIDFTRFRIKKMSVNSRGLSDYAGIGFHHAYGGSLKQVNIPIVAYPGEPLGEYSQTVLTEREINFDLSYISVAGVIGVNNITLEMEEGRPNFSFDTSYFSRQGEYVTPITGYIRSTFDEDRFSRVMEEVKKMNMLELPQVEEQFLTETTNDDDQWITDGTSGWNTGEITVTTLDPPTTVVDQPIVRSQLFRFPERSIRLGRIHRAGATLNVSWLSGTAKIVGLFATLNDGRTHYQDYSQTHNLVVGPDRQNIEFALSRTYSFSHITLYFEDVSIDGEVYIYWEGK